MSDKYELEEDKNLVEKKISSEDIFDGVLLHVKKDTVELPNGDISCREWIKHNGAAAVIPLTADNEVILVKQYRYPIQSITWEIPAGKLDTVTEDPFECAVRELKEETGYKAAEYKFLAKLATTVGFSNEFISIYAARGLEAGEMHLDEDEFINVYKIPLAEAVKMVEDGRIMDAKSVVGIIMLNDILKDNKW